MLSKNRAGSTPEETRAFQFLFTVFIFLSVFTLSFSGMHIPEPLAPGVVAEFRCNEGTGTTTTDGPGNGHNGTLTNGPACGAGKYGQSQVRWCLSFGEKNNETSYTVRYKPHGEDVR